MVSGRLRKKYGIEGEARDELYACADTWLAALSGRPFLGGAHPILPLILEAILALAVAKRLPEGRSVLWTLDATIIKC